MNFFLLIPVPPDITDETSSSDVTVKEGEDALLYCSANGHPKPRITWRREDGSYVTVTTKDGTSKKSKFLCVGVHVCQ